MNKDELLDKDNVQGLHEENGVVVVYVSEKKDKSRLRDEDVIPDKIDGKPVDVVQVGPPVEPKVMFDPYRDEYPHRDEPWDRPAGGLSISREGTGRGTGNHVFHHKPTDKYVGLTNEHVVEGGTGSVYQGSPYRGVEQGAVIRTSNREESGRDAAIYEVGLSALDDWSDMYLGIARWGGFREPPDEQTFYTKSGGRSDVTGAILVSRDATVRHNGVTYEGLHAFSNIGMPGDSGSLIGYVDENEDGEERFYATSLLRLGTMRLTWADPILGDDGVLDVVGELEGATIDPTEDRFSRWLRFYRDLF